MAAKKAVVPSIPAAVRAFGAALSAAPRAPIEIPGMKPRVIGEPRNKADLLSTWEGERFPDVRINHSYVFELHDGPLFLSVELEKNEKHWRLYARTDRRGEFAAGKMVFSLNLTLADDAEDKLTLQQRLRVSTQDMLPEDRLAAVNSLASRLRGLGLDVTPERDITFPTFKVQTRRFVGASTSAFIRDFVITGVIKGHYMDNKEYRLPGLESVPRRGSAASNVDSVLEDEEEAADNDGSFDPHDERDARRLTIAAIVRRRGQPAFRSALLDAYERKCAVTGCDVEDALEAAHITPYRGDHTNDVTNGLLLRSDIHTLFDIGKIAVDPATRKVLLADDLRTSMYQQYAGKSIRWPKDERRGPNKDALQKHRKAAGL